MSVLTRISEGMDVFDRTGDKIGEVDYVYFGDEDLATPEVDAATPSERVTRDDTIVDVVAEAFRTEDLPEELRERLQMHGFIKVSTGMLRSDRYALPEQIASVTGDAVHLNVVLDELIS